MAERSGLSLPCQSARRLNGEAVNSLTRIDCISRALNPYSQNAAFMALADQPEIRFVISNTTEAGIAFDPNCKFSDAPASSYPGKLTQLLYRRFKTFKGDKSKGLIIMPCELIFLNGHHLKECIYQYIELWKEDFGADYEKFKTWFTKYCYVCATLVDRIVPGFPRKEIAQIQKKSVMPTTWLCKPKSSICGLSKLPRTSLSASWQRSSLQTKPD